MAPIQLPDVAVTSPAVGQIVPLDLSAVTSLLPFEPGAPPAYLRIYNETGCSFDYQSASGVKDTIPSGAWPLIPLTGKDTGVSLKVKNIQAVAPISVVSATFYPPGEPIPQMPVLGNAPIGQSRVISIPTMPHARTIVSNLSLPYNTTPGAIPVFLTTAGPGIKTTLYIYNIIFLLTGLRYGNLGVYWGAFDGGSGPLLNVQICDMPLIAGRASPPLPQPISFGPQITPANTAFIGISLAWDTTIYPLTGTGIIAGTMLLDIDLTGQNPPPAIGNGAATPVGASY